MGKVWTNAAPCANINRFSQGKEGVAQDPVQLPAAATARGAGKDAKMQQKMVFFHVFFIFPSYTEL